MPAGGGEEARHGVGIWLKFPAHGQIIPVKCNQISPPHLIVANEPYTSQLYLENSTWFLFPSVYFDTKVF